MTLPDGPRHRAPDVAVLIPYRGDWGGHRDAAWAFMRTWWTDRHPDWRVVRGFCPDGPWCKALAVADALSRHTATTLVIADADVMCDGVGDTVNAVQAGAAWGIPHRRVHRLTDQATATLMSGGGLPDPARRTGKHAPNQRPPRPKGTGIVESYTGVPGGGMVVLPLATYRQVPLDPRFVGFGQEDTSWATALTVMYGPPQRGAADLWHLWHPPQPRLTRAVGSAEGLALHQRYRAATTRGQMRALLDEMPPPPC